MCEIIRQSTSKRISEKRIAYLTDKLIKLAKQSFCAVKNTSPMLEEVRYYAQELLRLSERRQVVLNDMVALAQPLPEYDILRSIPGIAETTATSIIGELEDIRRFQSTNQINAFIGIDLRHYESGNFSPRNTSLNEEIPMSEKSCSSAFTTSLQLVILIRAISLTFMRNEKDNRQQLQLSHIRLPLYIVSFEQCITSLRITNFMITLWPKIDKAVYAVLL